ncbi:hypothetical protein BB558_004974 [Smittium angustum]|uniref:Pheromone-processing carboxypeptidase KEX1 n=1 Tax=Smittium angustum TaxID=133377 RepID=A0A2U1IWV6_SMIAN|nr:hypothetical protein BB558_006783 [Smittium angustum]PVZ99026.1 hypothetical protein BB558_004974 [Smittium angustum]
MKLVKIFSLFFFTTYAQQTLHQSILDSKVPLEAVNPGDIKLDLSNPKISSILQLLNNEILKAQTQNVQLQDQPTAEPSSTENINTTQIPAAEPSGTKNINTTQIPAAEPSGTENINTTKVPTAEIQYAPIGNNIQISVLSTIETPTIGNTKPTEIQTDIIQTSFQLENQLTTQSTSTDDINPTKTHVFSIESKYTTLENINQKNTTNNSNDVAQNNYSTKADYSRTEDYTTLVSSSTYADTVDMTSGTYIETSLSTNPDIVSEEPKNTTESDINNKNSTKIHIKENFFVDSIPGVADDRLLVLKNYAGLVELDDLEKKLFFWLVKNTTNTKNDDSLIVWLNGGPGCSSMYGMFLENGPYQFGPKGDELIMREYPWTRQADMLYIDQPVGTGLSQSPQNKFISSYEQGNKDLIVFLAKFLDIFPEYKNRKIYFAGESDAGTVLIYLAKSLIKGDYGGIEANLGGLLIGNGWIDPYNIYKSYIPFLKSKGILDIETEKEMENNLSACLLNYTDNKLPPVRTNECATILQAFLLSSKKFKNTDRCYNTYNYDLSDSKPECGLNWPPEHSKMTEYMSRKQVQEALNIKANDINTYWKKCNYIVNFSYDHKSSVAGVNYLKEVLEKVPVLLYVGDKDISCNTLSFDNMIMDLEWNGAKGFTIYNTKTPNQNVDWVVNGNLIGKYYNERNLTYTILNNASHMAVRERPAQVLEILSHFANFDKSNIIDSVSQSNLRLLTEKNLGAMSESQSVGKNNKSVYVSIIIFFAFTIIVALSYILVKRYRRKGWSSKLQSSRRNQARTNMGGESFPLQNTSRNNSNQIEESGLESSDDENDNGYLC